MKGETMADSSKITMPFGLIDEFGNVYKTMSKIEIFDNIREDTINTIGIHFNNFLRQCGYPRYNDYLLMEDLTEDEVWRLSEYLDEIRNEENEE